MVPERVKCIGWTDRVRKGIPNRWCSCMEEARTKNKVSARNLQEVRRKRWPENTGWMVGKVSAVGMQEEGLSLLSALKSGSNVSVLFFFLRNRFIWLVKYQCTEFIETQSKTLFTLTFRSLTSYRWSVYVTRNSPNLLKKRFFVSNKVCYKVSLFENFQRQSCSMTIPVSNGR